MPSSWFLLSCWPLRATFWAQFLTIEVLIAKYSRPSIFPRESLPKGALQEQGAPPVASFTPSRKPGQ